MSVVREDGGILDHFFIQTQPKGTGRQVCHIQCIKLQKTATSTIYELQINGNEKWHTGFNPLAPGRYPVSDPGTVKLLDFVKQTGF